MKNSLRRTSKLLAAAAALAVSACGGGGAGGAQVASTPTPPPAPPPPPPPAPPPPAGAYLTPGVSQSTDFAVLGWEVDAGDATISAVATNGFAVRYDAASQSYSVALPSYQGAPASTFQQNGGSSLYYTGVINGGMSPATLAVRRPGPYQFTNIAGVDTLADYPTSVFAFGLATGAGSVPITGSASYSADVEGTSLSNLYYFRGAATLNFDFAAGTLGGQMGLDLYDLGGGAISIGTYSFQNTVYSSGSTTFSGAMRNTNGLGGTFVGQFTGPNAEELMARWNVEFLNPDTAAREAAIGALIGRRGP